MIYYVEKNPRYFPLVQSVFDRIDDGLLVAATSPITLAECCVIPYRLKLPNLQQTFFDIIVHGENTLFSPIDETIAIKAAELRAQYNLTLTDAVQIAVALEANCELFLTNDLKLKRISEIQVLVLDEFL